jgi:hypothetical protein
LCSSRKGDSPRNRPKEFPRGTQPCSLKHNHFASKTKLAFNLMLLLMFDEKHMVTNKLASFED